MKYRFVKLGWSADLWTVLWWLDDTTLRDAKLKTDEVRAWFRGFLV